MVIYKQPRRNSPVRQKGERKEPSILHPHKRYPVTQQEWERIKSQVFERSGGFCEGEQVTGVRCMTPIDRSTFDPHHVLARGKGGQDTVDNVIALCRETHNRIHGIPQWSKKS